jgi:serine/threonine protein kinase
MLTGRLPFEADTLPGLALAHLHEPPPSITIYNPAVPDQLARIILKVMSKEPAGRYRTAGQLAAILRSYKEQSQQETGPITAAGLAAAVGVSAVDDLPIALTPEVPAENRERLPVSERQTAVMDRPVVRSTRPRADAEMVVAPVPPEPAGEIESEKPTWPIILLGLIDILLLLGLIPLWFAVFLRWTQ